MADLKTIAQYLDATVNPVTGKQAEQALFSGEKTPGFAISLLQIVASSDFSQQTRLAGALFFKNFIRRNWVDEEGNHKLAESDVTTIKSMIVELMIQVPQSLQAQLGEAISIIADSDFLARWETLVDDLVSRLSADNAVVNNGVLTVAHSIFKKWRPLFRSDELFSEINFVLERFCSPYLTLLKATDNILEQNKGNKQAMDPYIHTLNLLIKLYYDLSCQDLPPFFETNLSEIMAIFYKYLTYNNPVLETDDDDEAGEIEHVKAGICEILKQYTQKYEDAFESLLPNFIRAVWELLTQIGLQPKYDILVSRALSFLTSIAYIQVHAENFNSEEVLSQVVEGVILPNMTLRESDVELFEDEPTEFIRRDLEGLDSDTRRRAATDFLRQLLDKFEKKVTDVVNRYIDHYLKEYAANPSENWKSKDTAIYLFSSIATKGTVTSVGVTSTNMLVDVVGFFTNNLRPDLHAPFDGVHPILKVDAIKYLYSFRSQMTKDQLKEAFSLLTNHLGSDNFVVYTYAAITIERILAMTTEGQPLFTAADVTQGKEIVQHLFTLIEKGGTPEKIAENEYPMKCIMRLLIVLKEGSASFAEIALGQLIKIVVETMKNPSNPRFTHYLFESFGAIIRFVGPSQSETLENGLYAPFISVLQTEVAEFIPYVFQLFALLLELSPSRPLLTQYKELIGPLLLPALWESRGNVPAIVRLLTAILPRAASDIVANNQLEPLLGVFQKLIAAKITEVNAFDLLEAIFANFEISALAPYIKQIFIIILTRLSNTRTEPLVLRFSRLVYILSIGTIPSTGPEFVISSVDQVQAGVFFQIYSNFVLPKTQSFALPLDRKFAAVGLANLLVTPSILKNPNPRVFAGTAEALLRLLELPQVPVTDGTDAALHDADIDELVFGVSFAGLNTCKKAPKDYAPNVTDVKKNLSDKLKEAQSGPDSAAVTTAVGGLSQELQAVLKNYFA